MKYNMSGVLTIIHHFLGKEDINLGLSAREELELF
jgi:hypothetical protein